MNRLLVNLYKNQLLTIRKGKGIVGKSNAKIFLLLALIDCVEYGWLKENHFHFEMELLGSIYDELFEYYQEVGYVPIHVPFYHLGSADFYHLHWHDVKQTSNKWHTPSAKYLREHLLYAEFDEELWILLQEKESRDFLKQSIVEYYLTPSTI